MSERWPRASVVLHWTSAVLLVGLALAGFAMAELGAPSPGRLLLARAHTAGGAALMLLTVARIVTRRRSPPAAPLPVSASHRWGIGLVHALLYAAILATGASGVVLGATTAWPGYLRGATAAAPMLSSLASRSVHQALVLALLGLVGLHAGGVLVLQLRRGAIIRRMVPFLDRPGAGVSRS